MSNLHTRNLQASKSVQCHRQNRVWAQSDVQSPDGRYTAQILGKALLVLSKSNPPEFPKRLLFSFGLIFSLTPSFASTVIITTNIQQSDLSSKYNETRVIFGEGASIRSKTVTKRSLFASIGLMTLGAKTLSVVNLAESSLGQSDQGVTLTIDGGGAERSVWIQNFGNSEQSKWGFGVNATGNSNSSNTKISLGFSNEEGAIVSMASTATGALAFTDRLELHNKNGALFEVAKSINSAKNTSELLLKNSGIIRKINGGGKQGEGMDNVIETPGKARIINYGVISGGILAAGLLDADQTNQGRSPSAPQQILNGGGKFDITNYGSILEGATAQGSRKNHAITLTSEANTIANYGKIDSICLKQADQYGNGPKVAMAILGSKSVVSSATIPQKLAVTLDNKGSIGSLHFENSKSAGSSGGTTPMEAVITLVDGFAFIAKDGPILRVGVGNGSQGSSSNAKIKLMGGEKHRFLVHVGRETTLGKSYSTDQVFHDESKGQSHRSGNQQGQSPQVKFVGPQGTEELTSKIPSIIAANLKVANPLFDLQVSGMAYSLDVSPRKGLDNFRALQSIESFSALSLRLQSVLDRSMGTLTKLKSSSLAKPTLSLAKLANGLDGTQSAFADARLAKATRAQSRSDALPKKSLEQKALEQGLLEQERAERRVQAQRTEEALSWNGFLIPYFSYLSLTPESLLPLGVKLGGLIGGATKRLDSGIQVGFHLALEHQSSELTQQTENSLPSQYQLSGFTTLLGVHTKIPFHSLDFTLRGTRLTLTPFMRSEFSAMLLQNSYALTNTYELTQRLALFSGGASLDVLGGVEMGSEYGSVGLETGLSQQVIHLPELSFINQTRTPQIYEASTPTPLYYLLQAKYSYGFIFPLFTLTPRIKLGLQATLVGWEKEIRLSLFDRSYKAVQRLDAASGIVELGVDFALKIPFNFELNYLGEYGSRAQSHSVDLRVGMKF